MWGPTPQAWILDISPEIEPKQPIPLAKTHRIEDLGKRKVFTMDITKS